MSTARLSDKEYAHRRSRHREYINCSVERYTVPTRQEASPECGKRLFARNAPKSGHLAPEQEATGSSPVGRTISTQKTAPIPAPTTTSCVLGVIDHSWHSSVNGLLGVCFNTCETWHLSGRGRAMTEHPLVGTWRLVSYEERDEDGGITHPLGRDPVGFLTYTADGYMAGQLGRADRASG